jgi:serine/threonine-protein kinase
VLAKLSGPHAVRVLDAGRLPDGSPYLVMERLTGEPLSARLESGGPLPLAQALTFARQVCDAVSEAHSCGIVHRDLKPSNVFMLGEDRIKVLDFGLAMRLDAVGQDSVVTRSEFAGSPRYMSPEQIRASADVTPSTDVWSLGVLLFEMLTGRQPFEGVNTGAVLASIVADPGTRLRELLPSAPPELDRLIADCLEKNPADRPESTAAVRARLDAITSGGSSVDDFPSVRPSVPAQEPDDATVADPVSRRRNGDSRERWRLVAWLLAGAALTLLVALALYDQGEAPAKQTEPHVGQTQEPAPTTERAALRPAVEASERPQRAQPIEVVTVKDTPPGAPQAAKSAPSRPPQTPDVLDAIRTRH